MLLGPPPSYSEAISSLSSSSSTNQPQQQIFSITQYTPPPSYSGRGRELNTSTPRQNTRTSQQQQQQNTRHNLSCNSRLNNNCCSSNQRNNNNVGRTQLIFPYNQNNDVENSSISPTYRADRLRDLFLSILARILVIFLFVVFIRLMIAQLNN